MAMAEHEEKEGMEEVEEGQTCAECGMEIEGNGYKKEGRVYCCEGCAEDTGCTCASEDEETEESGILEHPESRRQRSDSSKSKGRETQRRPKTGRRTKRRAA